MLSSIIQSVEKQSSLISEVAKASREQSAGIEQINKGIIQIDSVTQTNASEAEQFAASGSALSDQAEHLESAIQELVHLVEGKGKG